MSRFADRAADALAAQFAEFGDAARYTPPGGGATTDCTIIRDREDIDTGIGPSVAQRDVIEVRQSELASPARGGSFALLDAAGTPTGETVKVLDDPRTPDDDAERLLWRMTVSKQA